MADPRQEDIGQTHTPRPFGRTLCPLDSEVWKELEARRAAASPRVILVAIRTRNTPMEDRFRKALEGFQVLFTNPIGPVVEQAVLNYNPDLVIVELQEQSGTNHGIFVGIHRQQRNRPNQLALIVLTSPQESEEARRRITTTGVRVSEWLETPFRSPHLLAAVRRHIPERS